MLKRVAVVIIATFAGAGVSVAQTRSGADQTLDVKSLEAALAARPQGADGERLADRIRVMFGGRDALIRGAAPKVDETTVAWALELPEPLAAGAAVPRVARDVGNFNMPMVRVGNTNVYALVR